MLHSPHEVLVHTVFLLYKLLTNFLGLIFISVLGNLDMSSTKFSFELVSFPQYIV